MNIETIEQIVALVSEQPVSEITVEHGGDRVRVRKSALSVPRPKQHAAEASASENSPAVPEEATVAAPSEPEPIVLTSPMVGFFHHLTHPVPYGGLITLNQIVGSIESMKLMNDVPAEHSGRVVEVLIEDGAPVEYGQPLFRLSAV